MTQPVREASPVGLTKMKSNTTKTPQIFHSQIQPQQNHALDTEGSLKASIELKNRSGRGKLSTIDTIDGKSTRPFDALTRGPDFSELDQRRAAQFYKRQCDLKDSKIREMTVKVNHLMNKLRLFMNEEQIGMQLPTVEDNDKKIRRLENLLRIKNEQVLFKIKIQAANLLTQFQIDKADITGINYLESQNEIFEFLMGKLKQKLKDMRTREKENGEWRRDGKMEQERNSETIHFLTETNEILKNSQSRLKQKLQEIKHEWNVACQKVSERDRIIEERDNQIFKLKKMYEDLQGQHLRISASQRQLSLQMDNQKRQFEVNTKELRNLLTTYNLQKKQYQILLDEKDELIEQMDIKAKFSQEQFEKVNREYVRWKERYEWLEKEKQSKLVSYREELDKIVKEYQDYKGQFNVEELNKVKNQLEIAYKQLVQERALTSKYEEELQYMQDNRVDLEEAYLKKSATLEAQHMKKNQNFQQAKQSHFDQILKLRQQLESQREQEEQKWRKKAEELQGHHKTKITQLEELNAEKLAEKDHEMQMLRDQITEKDKLITVLYPKTGGTT